MFCVLKINQRERNIIERLFGKFRKDEYELKTVHVFKGAPFYQLNVVVGEKGVEWEQVVRIVGKCAIRLLTSPEMDIPQNKYIGTFRSDKLYKIMMLNTFTDILKMQKKPVSICITDKKAEYGDFTLRLVKYASQLSVVTMNKGEYIKLCDEIQKINGLCPEILSDVANSQVYIDTENSIMKINWGEVYVEICNGQDFSVHEMYEKLLPEGVNKYDFYSALYELCGVFAINQCSFDTVIVNNEKRCVADIHFS